MANNGFILYTQHFDPYKNFKFRVLWDDKAVLGASKASWLDQATNVVNYRSGGENEIDERSTGRSSHRALTLERGITRDPEFDAWASKIHASAGDFKTDQAADKKELTLEVMNEHGQVAKRYFLHECWVSVYAATPDLDANANTVGIEHVTIEIETLECDTSNIAHG